MSTSTERLPWMPASIVVANKSRVVVHRAPLVEAQLKLSRLGVDYVKESEIPNTAKSTTVGA